MGDKPRPSVAVRATRIWLPLAIAVVGVVMIVLGHASVSTRGDTRSLLAGAGVVVVGIALMVWMINWMFRMSVESNRDREVEERAREYFDLHGHWPGEEPE
jgi:protein-S-isoprenylcysteine O-methyltransferase Ste14